MTRSPGWKRKLFLGGLWLLLFPPLGWPLALGYRKEVALRLVEGREPVLPDWGDWKAFLGDGIKATGVILGYYVPFLAVFWSLALSRPAVVLEHPGPIAAFFVAVPVLAPVSLSVLPPLYWHWFPWVELSAGEMVLVGAVFWGTAFLMPAAFLQVSVHGSFRHAFRPGRVVRLIARHPRLYLEAWALALAATGAALLTGPLAPWGIFWSYLVIVFAFNNVLARSSEPEMLERFRGARLFHRGRR